MKQLICIVCPKGCHLQVDEANGFATTGNACPRGADYAKAELTNPTRVVTSTVAVTGAHHRRCPVKTAAPIPKGKITAVMQALESVRLQAPVALGQIVLENVCDTGVPVIATRDLFA